MTERNKSGEAPIVGTTGDAYAATQDPYLKHVMRHIHIQSNPYANDPNYPGVDWDREMKKHLEEKYNISRHRSAAVIIGCKNNVLDEHRQELASGEA